ncbi:hypothetical protein [Endozoicomonas numazuensis]|uniref:Uncharacterized protein n=1 Tax=Endozoicomonas numazuensis TaxID=1137799 RepID=A0A081NJ26_9GAMM|nr:hypothetical protein [Endozoicomonas numazuensis]KEQ18449.1 hypothetical protein GZ78_13245 [Endozoicomonas numazuensis]
MIPVVRSSLCLIALSLPAHLMADCDIPLGKYTAAWTGHADKHSVKKLNSATTELVIRKKKNDEELIFDWTLKLEPSDDKQEIYDLGKYGTVTCEDHTLSLQFSTFRDRAYNEAGLLTFWMYNIKDIMLREKGSKKGTVLTFEFQPDAQNSQNGKMVSLTANTYFDFFHRAKSRHLYLKQSEEQPFVLNWNGPVQNDNDE